MPWMALTAGQGKEDLDTHIPKHSKKKWESKEPKDEGKNGITRLVPQLTRERGYLTQARGRGSRDGRDPSVMWYGTLNEVRWRREIPRSQGIWTPAESVERASEKSQGEMIQSCPHLAKKLTARLEAGKSLLALPSPLSSNSNLKGSPSMGQNPQSPLRGAAVLPSTRQ